ncbi:MAG: Lrp/AsnC family transcriptional regulator [Phycisphaeraceae bacterium]
MSHETLPVAVEDPLNSQILAVAEDRIRGFHEKPFHAIAERAEVPLETVVERIRAMLDAGVIRRVRQTMLSTSLAPGALVAWKVPEEKLAEAFDWMCREDPFTGHVVIRSTDAPTPGAAYRLWTTLKVPQGFSMEKHADYLRDAVGAEAYRLMPAKRLFVLGVGHVRRQKLPIGSKSDHPGEVRDTEVVELNDEQWTVLAALKRELDPEEVAPEPWRKRAADVDMDYLRFLDVARQLEEKGVIGRFSTFLEHVKKTAGGEAVTRYNALFHWRVPEGREIEAGKEVGRFHCMTHAYWREGGPEFNHVNIMGVAHHREKERVLAHKAAIDAHLESAGIPVLYTNVFWGGRSEIKPSEVLPTEYEKWCETRGIESQTMRR